MRATIKLGDTGDDVKRIQRVFARNKVLGLDDVDGLFGPRTEQAVKDFQQSNGLVADGIVGPITWSHVHPYREASPTLQAGSSGPVVAMLQGVLKTGFGYAGAIDGIFGPATEAVVRHVPDQLWALSHRGRGRADLDVSRRCRGRNAREPLRSDPLTAARLPNGLRDICIPLRDNCPPAVHVEIGAQCFTTPSLCPSRHALGRPCVRPLPI